MISGAVALRLSAGYGPYNAEPASEFTTDLPISGKLAFETARKG
jgi:hypothetical protein